MDKNETKVIENHEMEAIIKGMGLNQVKPLEKTVPILDDGKQYSVKIPKVISDSMKINAKKHKLKFIVTTRTKEEKIIKELSVEIV